jgi:hypothetical protein
MGTTSVRVTASSIDPCTAFVSCGSDFCRVRCSARDSSTLDIESIWFTERTRPGSLQAAVTAVYQLPFEKERNTAGRNLGGFLFAVSGDQFHFSQLDSDIKCTVHDVPIIAKEDVRVVPRKLLTTAKPTCVTYLRPVRKMVIATMEAKEARAPPHGYRILHSAIKLLDTHDQKTLDEPEIKQEDGGSLANTLVAAQHDLKHGERVYSIVEWPFIDHRNKKYTLLIVGTGVPGSAGKESGRRLIFNVGRNEQNAKLQLKKESTFDSPVYCTAVFGNETSVSAIGRNLTFDVFQSEIGL